MIIKKQKKKKTGLLHINIKTGTRDTQNKTLTFNTNNKKIFVEKLKYNQS